MINSLTSFRFFAALMVFLYHIGVTAQLELGTAGVQFFFVLSGFILAYNYHSKFTELEGVRIKKFYIARFAKIYPVHVLTFLISLPLALLYFNPQGLYFIKLAYMSSINLLLIQSFFPNQATYFNFNGVSWTLSVEAIFYLTFPFLVWIFTKLRMNKNVFRAFFLFLAIWIALLLLNAKLTEDNSFYVWLLHIFPVARLFEFACGAVLGLIFVEKFSGVNQVKSKFTVLELLSVGLFIVLLVVSRGVDVGIVRGVYFVPIWCLLIFVYAFQGGLISKVLSNKTLVYLGEISFSFYMVHQLVIRYMDFLTIPVIYKSSISFILSILLSSLIFKFYEEPLRKKLRYGFNHSNKQKSMQLPSSPSIESRLS
ncbi:acyltransferase family protein [Paenibacillus sp. UNC451MF]|uniref:acyltransferase family protein n=1 Tax=Paenibacillus sp. UNC451MF TaxID=1449063 RepID=UPI00048FB7DD|nr:acyltransferase [Paenibacillus sp. UNC451MF]